MIILWILALTLLSSAQGEQFYASPFPSAPCPHGATCFNLNDLSRPINPQFFSSNSVVTFLSGTHRITNERNSLLFIKDVQNLTLAGEPNGTCEIVCEKPFAFIFINVTQLSISHLTLTNCSAQTNENIINDTLSHISQPFYSFSPLEYVALFFVHIVNFEMSHVTVQNNTGFGFLGFNIIGESSISHSTFSFNNYQTHQDDKCKSLSTKSQYECTGGGLVIGYADTMDCLDGTSFLNITSTFIGYGANPSSAGGGLALVLSQSSFGVHILMDNVTAINNSASRGANMFLVVFDVTDNSTFTLSNSLSGYSNPFLNTFELASQNGRNDYIGGGLYYSYGRSVPTMFGETGLCSSSPKRYESKLLAVFNTTFTGNKGGTGAGAFVSFVRVQSSDFPAQITFEDCLFTDNIGVQGSAMFLAQLEPIETELLAQFHFKNCNISNNSYPEPRAIDISQEVEFDVFTTVFLNFIQDVSFTTCRFSENLGSALYGYSTRMRFFGDTLFEKNQGLDGGALAIHGNSLMVISSNTSLTFVQNSANRGGAIYVANQNYRAKVLCFWQIDHSSLEEFGIPIEFAPLNRTAPVDIKGVLDIHLEFRDNTAEVAGTALYGGNIDRCLLIFSVNHVGYTSRKIFDNLFNFDNQTSTENVNTSLISSDPIRVCFCTDNVPDCNKHQHNISRYPGQSFVVSAVTVGQRNEISPGTVFAHFTSDSGSLDASSILGESQVIQQSGKSCTNIKYTVSSTLHNLSLTLRSANTFLENTQTQVLITLETCPLGFTLSPNPPMCVCSTVLDNQNVECDIENQTIHRKPPIWIGKDSREYYSGEHDHVVFHDYCPFGYCVPNEIKLTLLEQDVQCAHNRTGTVCGSCSPGLSATLGSNYCLECSNYYLLLLIVFAVVGLLLVFSLYLCNTLNVSVGTINGLIFYANIIQINKEIFFPPNHYNFTTVFIAWLNLDLGIRTCFYEGMDTYAKTWLQFAFPLYILAILSLIILISHYSASVSKLFSKNAVQVLATILLLLFSKGQRILINCLSYATLQHSNGHTSKVWLFDANVPYLEGKHIYLFIVGNILFFLVLTPFTFVLLFSRYFQALSTHRIFHWVNKLKPLFDAYMAPYKDNYRYWAGFLLFVRGALFVVYAFNILYGPDLILLVTAVVSQLLSIFTWFSGGMYKKWPLNALEFSFFLNLSILSTTTLFVRKVQGYPEGAVYTSVTIAFLEFVGIIIYSVYHRLSSTNLNTKVKSRVQRIKIPLFLSKVSGWFKRKNRSQTNESINGPRVRRVTSTTVDSPGDYDETLVVSVDDDSDKFIELREPLMESL